LLSTYATLIPGKETYRDFTTPQVYRVQAEDGSEVSYSVIVTKEGANPQLENSTLDAWYTPTGKNYEEPGADASTIWASGNAGVVTINTANVTPVVIAGSDKAAKLVTKDLGSLGQLVGQSVWVPAVFLPVSLNWILPTRSTVPNSVFRLVQDLFRFRWSIPINPARLTETTAGRN
jgi:hypothetical protein